MNHYLTDELQKLILAITVSEFQRAFSVLDVNQLLVPSPQAKEKLECPIGTLQKRLVALLAYEKASNEKVSDLHAK